MQVHFAARLKNFNVGQFGPKEDLQGRQAYQDLKQVFESPELKTLFETAGKSVDVVVSNSADYSDNKERSVHLKIAPKFFFNASWSQDEGKEIITIGFNQIKHCKDAVVKHFSELFSILDPMEVTENKLKQIGNELNIQGITLEERQNRNYVCLDSWDIKIADQMLKLLSAPDVAAVLRKNKEYKTHAINQKVTDRDYLDKASQAKHGVDYHALEKATQQELFETTIPPMEFSLGSYVINTRIKYDKEKYTTQYWPGLEDWFPQANKKHGTVKFTLQEMMENPQAVKQRIQESQQFWNEKLNEYLGES